MSRQSASTISARRMPWNPCEQVGPLYDRIITGEGRLEYAFALLRRKGQALGAAIGNGVELDIDHWIGGDFAIAFCIPEKRAQRRDVITDCVVTEIGF
jgi:hypothetical protein